MKKRKVIKRDNFKQRSPINASITFFLFFKYINAPDWVYGMFFTLIFFWSISFLIDIMNTEEVDLFRENKDRISTTKKPFRVKLKEKLDE